MNLFRIRSTENGDRSPEHTHRVSNGATKARVNKRSWLPLPPESRRVLNTLPPTPLPAIGDMYGSDAAALVATSNFLYPPGDRRAEHEEHSLPTADSIWRRNLA